MRVCVTGVAGFIGNRVARQCLLRGYEVVGVDCFTDYYARSQKQENIQDFLLHDQFALVDDDLVECQLDFLDEVDVVFHLAGQPGVRQSWREEFGIYLSRNVLATQRLLDKCLVVGVSRFVYSSSSSVYGKAMSYPVDESMRPQPFSPYGVTKLAGEHLCSLYAENFGLSTVSLRYFTVYGPGQRPDMATNRLFRAALTGSSFPLFGTGEQVRDFTFVDDVVQANILAAEADIEPGFVCNVAGGGESSMNELIELVERVSGRAIEVDRRNSERGDVRRTGGIVEVAARYLGWHPRTSLLVGLEQQYEWHLAKL